MVHVVAVQMKMHEYNTFEKVRDLVAAIPADQLSIEAIRDILHTNFDKVEHADHIWITQHDLLMEVVPCYIRGYDGARIIFWYPASRVDENVAELHYILSASTQPHRLRKTFVE